eukprot:CAMPEP_0173433976 /NCGR_PEP_ID=MMETSP1357-20121228/11215_1 /TAXON_ID=77926 /ORGANISM="Hemiselmis rufescens, Strain PCC563" /LENGTH=45 /DNA_ID= /DNA_START= /DNA_END= /DNA_ORIENTATION=
MPHARLVAACVAVCLAEYASGFTAYTPLSAARERAIVAGQGSSAT